MEKLEEKHEKHSHLFTWLEARGFFSDDATAVVTEAPVRRSGTRSKTNPGETARHLAAVQSIHDDEGE